MKRSLAPLLLGALTAALAGGCSRSIGDDCETNVQCSAQGDRQCDTSQPSGYCTVEGCDVNSCPDDALCVRFFPPGALVQTCTYTDPLACAEREVCLSQGYCVETRLERRFCMKSCSSNGDCREGYECRMTGSGGAELLPGRNGSPPRIARFCTARPRSIIRDGGVAASASTEP